MPRGGGAARGDASDLPRTMGLSAPELIPHQGIVLRAKMGQRLLGLLHGVLACEWPYCDAGAYVLKA